MQTQLPWCLFFSLYQKLLDWSMKFTFHCVSFPPFPGFLCANTAAKPKPAKAVLSFIVGTTGNFLLLSAFIVYQKWLFDMSTCSGVKTSLEISQHVLFSCGSSRIWTGTQTTLLAYGRRQMIVLLYMTCIHNARGMIKIFHGGGQGRWHLQTPYKHFCLYPPHDLRHPSLLPPQTTTPLPSKNFDHTPVWLGGKICLYHFHSDYSPPQPDVFSHAELPASSFSIYAFSRT